MFVGHRASPPIELLLLVPLDSARLAMFPCHCSTRSRHDAALALEAESRGARLFVYVRNIRQRGSSKGVDRSRCWVGYGA